MLSPTACPDCPTTLRSLHATAQCRTCEPGEGGEVDYLAGHDWPQWEEGLGKVGEPAPAARGRGRGRLLVEDDSRWSVWDHPIYNRPSRRNAVTRGQLLAAVLLVLLVITWKSETSGIEAPWCVPPGAETATSTGEPEAPPTGRTTPS